MLPLLKQLNAIVAEPTRRDPFACRHCIDGEREDGGLCPWCDGEDDPDPTPAEEAAEAERLRAAEAQYYGRRR